MIDITVEGGVSLRGIITPQGSKNAALPIIFATVVTGGVSRIGDVPEIDDVRVALKLIEGLGAKVERRASELIIDTRRLTYKIPDPCLTAKIRASTYLLGAALSRFGRANIGNFGGCAFSARPIDMHVYAAHTLGAVQIGDEITAPHLNGAVIDFDKISVGATVNAILMAVSARGVTKIKNAAKEPHIIALESFLTSAGAVIERSGNELTVVGSDLSGARFSMIPDMIEAGTYLLLAPLTDGDVAVKYPSPEELESLCSLLCDCGVSVSTDNGYIRARGTPTRSIYVRTEPYPGYPTDLQPQIAPLMARFYGGKIDETVWRSRFGYLDALSAFGVMSARGDGEARIYPSSLHSAEVQGSDLRASAAELMCALCADGVSRIRGADAILRGYEGLERKIRSLGGRIFVRNKYS